MNSLAIMPEKETTHCEPMRMKESEPEPSYPDMSIRDGQIKSFLSGQRLELDKVYEVPIRFKVKGFSDDKYDKCLRLCVLESGEITEVGKAMDSESEDEGEEEEEGEEESEESDPVIKAITYSK